MRIRVSAADALSRKGTVSAGAIEMAHLVVMAPFAMSQLTFVAPVAGRHGNQTHLTLTEEANLQHSTSNKAKLMADIYKLFVAMARSCAAVFGKGFIREGDREVQGSGLWKVSSLDTAIRDTRRRLSELWPAYFSNRPNMIAGLHFKETAERFGRILAVPKEETKHAFFKQAVRSTSGRKTALELLQHANTYEAVAFLRRLVEARHWEHPFLKKLPPVIQTFIKSDNKGLYALLQPKSLASSYGTDAGGGNNFDENKEPWIGATKSEKLVLKPFEMRRLIALLTVENLSEGDDDLDEEDGREDTPVEQYVSVLLPGRKRRTQMLWADQDKKGSSYYNVPSLDDGSSLCVVRLDALFTAAVNEEDSGEIFARVRWGVKEPAHTDKTTGFTCFEFEYDERQQEILANQGKHSILRASELGDAVHMGWLSKRSRSEQEWTSHLHRNDFYFSLH